MSTQHTPGPWHREVVPLEPCGEQVIIFPEAPGAEGIAGILAVSSEDEMNMNARLIASAPDLLAERDRLRESNEELLEACKAAWKYLDLDSALLPEGSALGELSSQLEAAIAHAQEQKP